MQKSQGNPGKRAGYFFRKYSSPGELMAKTDKRRN
jgi:hypothetical protein